MSVRLGVLVVVCLTVPSACLSGSRDAPSREPAVSDAGRPVPQVAACTPDENWQLRRTGGQHAIEGYADEVSVLPGRSFRLFVSTTSARFRVSAFRVGWYGGAKACRVWRSAFASGTRQPHPTVSSATNTVETAWRPSLTVDTEGWRPGSYLLRLEASSGAQRFVPLTVRTPRPAGRLVLLNAVHTWQAYNTWGGYSLYHGPQGVLDDENRSRAVSFDRPYDESGAGKFLVFERPVILLAERLGLPLAYVTTADLAREPGLLHDARAVVSLGHDEYWSASMRQAVTSARRSGTNVAFLGANAVYRRIRLAPTALAADRLVVHYRIPEEDPLYDRHRARATGNWEDPPVSAPQSVLTGAVYECYGASAPLVVTRPGHWLFAGAKVRRGTQFPGLVGPEYDRLDRDLPLPGPVEVVSRSPLTCAGDRSHADMVYYTTDSGAAGFNAGTMRWVCALRRNCGETYGIDGRARRFVARTTTNLLRAFAHGPAGSTHLVAAKPR